jgi:hypothetical protein
MAYLKMKNFFPRWSIELPSLENSHWHRARRSAAPAEVMGNIRI